LPFDQTIKLTHKKFVKGEDSSSNKQEI